MGASMNLVCVNICSSQNPSTIESPTQQHAEDQSPQPAFVEEDLLSSYLSTESSKTHSLFSKLCFKYYTHYYLSSCVSSSSSNLNSETH